jgi:hypothetical protein
MSARTSVPANGDTYRVVTSPEELMMTTTWGRDLFFGRLPVVLRVQGLSEQERALWQTAINRESTACGCKASALAICIVEVAYVASLLATTPTMSDWVALAYGISLALAAGLLGKVIGIMRSEIRRRRIMLDLIAAMASASDREAS